MKKIIEKYYKPKINILDKSKLKLTKKIEQYIYQEVGDYKEVMNQTAMVADTLQKIYHGNIHLINDNILKETANLLGVSNEKI